MDLGRSAVDFAKRIVELEVQCGQLKEENINLKEVVMEVNGNEEKTKGKYVKVKEMYMKAKEEFGSEKREWREEEERITEKYRQLMVEKRKLEIDLEAAVRRVGDGGGDAAKSLEDEAKGLMSLLEEKDCTITTLLAKNESLERNVGRLEMDFEARMAMEAEKLKVEEEEKILALALRIQDLEREKGQLEAEVCKVKEDKNNEAEKAKRTIDEHVKRVGVLERIKEAEMRAIEDEGRKQVLELTCRIQFLKREKRDFEARMAIEAKKLKVEEEEKILVLAEKIQDLEREKGQLEAEFCKVEEDKNNEAEKAKRTIDGLVKRVDVVERGKEAEMRAIEDEGKKQVLELTYRIEVLNKEKREMEAMFCEVNKEMSEEIKRVLKVKTDVEAGKTAVEAESKERILELRKRNEVLEREKREVEAESKKRVLELIQKNDVLEREMREVEAGNKKRVLELIQRNKVLEREMREVEAEVCRAKRQKSEEIKKRILDEKTALKEKYMKETLHLISRSGILEREKQRLEAEIMEKDERIKALVQEKEGLVAKKKKMQIRMNSCVVKPMEDVKLAHLVHPASNVGIFGTLTKHSQGPKSNDVSVTEKKDSSDGGKQLTGLLGAEIQKRKVKELGCSVADQDGTKRCKLDGLIEAQLKNGRGMALGELLTSGVYKKED